MKKFVFTYMVILLGIGSVFAQRSKMSPFVRQAAQSGAVKGNVSMSKGCSVSTRNTPFLTAFVEAADRSVLDKHGCRILAQWDDTSTELSTGTSTELSTSIYIAAIPLTEIDALAAEKQVSRIEAGKSCSITNDTTATITHAREVWNSPSPITPQPSVQLEDNRTFITGNGVVVGVMDIGFDLTHPTFYSRDGQAYRIKQLWDQLDQTQGGEPVIGNDTIYVGRQYIGQEALLALQHSYDGLTQTHGTHTTGTAAGSSWEGGSESVGYGGPYSGMAPDADICLVCNMAGNNVDLVPESEWYRYTTATDMLGFKYIFDYADKVRKPCVISFSEGQNDDLWESGLYSKVLSKMLGPGHILCASAGNEGSGDGTYIHKAEGETSKGAFLAKWASNTAVYVMRSKKPLQMRLSFFQSNKNVLDKDYDFTGLTIDGDSIIEDTIFVGGDSLIVFLESYASCFDDNLYATDLFLTDHHNTSCGYAVPTALTLLGEDNDIEAFCCGGYFVRNSLCDPSLADFDTTHNVLFPGSSKDVVCVGATSYATSWKNVRGNYVGTNFGTGGVRARYSSVGPALNGLTKPDVMAPGSNIISSRSSFYRDYGSEILLSEYNGSTYPWGMMSGTSMATPVTAGIVALWLQVCPTLTPDDVKDVIANTATHYDKSLTYPNNYYGWGQIDAMAGVEYIRRHLLVASDVNKDFTTNISDVNAVISAICGESAYSKYADVNGDDNIDVNDVNAVINVICRKE